MAIISDIQEEQQQKSPPQAKSASGSGSSSSGARVAATSFSTKFDRNNTSGFLEKALEFLAQESDFMRRPTAERDLVAIFKAVRERERKKMEEERKKRWAEEEEEKKKKAEAEVKAKEEAKAETKVVAEEKKEKEAEEKKVEEKSGKRVPNKGNGLDLEKYSWTQSLQEVNIIIPVPAGTKSRDIVYEAKKNRLKFGLKGQPLIIDGSLTFFSLRVKTLILVSAASEERSEENRTVDLGVRLDLRVLFQCLEILHLRNFVAILLLFKAKHPSRTTNLSERDLNRIASNESKSF